jgi:hypothetical protein
MHLGFDRDELTKMLDQAGFGHARFSSPHSVEKHGQTYPLFLAVAMKP